MSFRGKDDLITHNNAAYIPSSMMPGYLGHIPTTKFCNGETFGNSTLQYFQDNHSAMMSPSKNLYNNGATFLSSQTQDSALTLPYWLRYNTDFRRQKEIKDFSMLSQKHRENYKDKTATVQPVNYFSVPLKITEKKPPEAI